MKAIVFKDLATWTYEERSVPEICGTDVHVLGNPP